MIPISVMISAKIKIVAFYEARDPIWNLPHEKMERKAISDAQRALAIEADKRAATPQTVRG